MELLFILGIPCLIIGLSTVSGLWITHLSMCMDHARSNHLPYGWARFKKFREEFYKKTWKEDEHFKSWFGEGHLGSISYDGNYIHASIIAIDGKIMLLDPISFFRFEIFRSSYFKKRKGNLQRCSWYKTNIT